ncbi:MAG: hypothetical protein ACW7DP_15260 [Paraglaciecola chathamensis]
MNQLRGGILPEEMGIHTGFGYVQRLVIRCACLCTSCTRHSFAAYTLRVPSMRFAYLGTACIRHSFAVYGLRPHYALRAPASMLGMTDNPWSASHFFPTVERSDQDKMVGNHFELTK